MDVSLSLDMAETRSELVARNVRGPFCPSMMLSLCIDGKATGRLAAIRKLLEVTGDWWRKKL